MAANLNTLEPNFRAKAETLIANCKSNGIEMRPYWALRSPPEQAKVWRQSRTIEEITQKIAELKENKAFYLAECLLNAGPQYGKFCTNAIPGLSWHQWGEAMDCFWVVENNAEWSTRILINGINGYSRYAELAENLGLTAGGHWANLKDWAHVQLRSERSPLNSFSISEIDQTMKKRFS